MTGIPSNRLSGLRDVPTAGKQPLRRDAFLCCFRCHDRFCSWRAVLRRAYEKTHTTLLMTGKKNIRKLLFHDNLKSLMKQRGFSQMMLAESTGISQSAISLYITGRSIPKAGELQRMADALAVSMDYLWRKVGPETIQESSYYEKKWRETEKELVKLREALKLLVNNVSQ